MKKIITLTLCILLSISLMACSAQTYDTSSSEGAYAYDVAPQEAPAAAESYSYDYDYDYEYEETGEMSEEAISGGIGDLPNNDIIDTNRKLIYSSNFTMQTQNYDEDYATIKNTLSSLGGYVENESTWSDIGEYSTLRHSDLSLRIPTENYNEFLDTISGVGTIVDKQLYTDDVSDQYFDTESRIEILEARQERLMEYLETAVKIEDIIELEAELSEVLYELDVLKGQNKGIDQMVDYAQVSISISEVLTPTTSQNNNVPPLNERASNAYQVSVENVKQFFENFAVVMAALAPVLIILLIIVVIILIAVKLILKAVKKYRVKHPKEK